MSLINFLSSIENSFDIPFFCKIYILTASVSNTQLYSQNIYTYFGQDYNADLQTNTSHKQDIQALSTTPARSIYNTKCTCTNVKVATDKINTPHRPFAMKYNLQIKPRFKYQRILQCIYGNYLYMLNSYSANDFYRSLLKSQPNIGISSSNLSEHYLYLDYFENYSVSNLAKLCR